MPKPNPKQLNLLIFLSDLSDSRTEREKVLAAGYRDVKRASALKKEPWFREELERRIRNAYSAQTKKRVKVIEDNMYERAANGDNIAAKIYLQHHKPPEAPAEVVCPGCKELEGKSEAELEAIVAEGMAGNKRLKKLVKEAERKQKDKAFRGKVDQFLSKVTEKAGSSSGEL